MRRAAVLLLALAACTDETVLTPSPPPTTSAVEVVAGPGYVPGPGQATTTIPEPEPEPGPLPAEQSGPTFPPFSASVAPPSTAGSGTSTTIPAGSIATGPLPVNLGQSAVASWYGDELRGSPTASGEPFNPDDLTTAHRSLAFGTRVSVCHNGCVVVRVNDRGPFVGGRSFDLSRAAFASIAPLGAGVVSITWAVVG